MPPTARCDKWLWAARFFKTRGLAAEMCATGKVTRFGRVLKASTALHSGDVLEIPFPEGPGTRAISVVSIIRKRVASPEARACYEELTAPDVFEIQKSWHLARQAPPGGRPTKKNRREIDRIHGFRD